MTWNLGLYRKQGGVVIFFGKAVFFNMYIDFSKNKLDTTTIDKEVIK